MVFFMGSENLNAGHRQRLRTRYMLNGLLSFLDYEILELILTCAIPRKDTKPIAKQLLLKFGNFSNVLNASVSELTEVDGIGPKAAFLLTLFKPVFLYYFQNMQVEGKNNLSRDFYIKYFRLLFDSATNEKFAVILYDVSGEIIGTKVMDGDVSYINVNLRDVSSFAVSHSAAFVVIAHNHPHGKAFFSHEDAVFTDKLSQALKFFDIQLYDHVVIAGTEYVCFPDAPARMNDKRVQ